MPTEHRWVLAHGQSRACRYQQRLAVVLANNPEGDVLQVTLPATSIFGKEDGEKRPLQAYARYMAAQTPPVNLDSIVTRMKFDTKAESPKLFFAPVRWLTDDEYETAQDSEPSPRMLRRPWLLPLPLLMALPPLHRWLSKASVLSYGRNDGRRRAEAMAEVKAAKAKKAKAVEVEAEEEPEVRKAPAKVEVRTS
jgi:hypothetical protein